LADRVSASFVPVVIALAAATLGFWLTAAATDSATAAFTAAVAVLIIGYPCALGLATSTALMVGTRRGAQLGILINGPEVLESTRQIDTVVLDKTGTVTAGHMALVDVATVAGVSGSRSSARTATITIRFITLALVRPERDRTRSCDQAGRAGAAPPVRCLRRSNPASDQRCDPYPSAPQ
jgi:P-type E1-E2 ATPase